MLAYVIRRLFALVIVVLAATILMFVITHLAPGSPVYLLVESPAVKAYDMSAIRSGEVPKGAVEAIEAIKARWGLDKPLYVQLGVYLANLLTLDLGKSLFSQREVSQDIRMFLPATLELTLVGVIGATLGGILAALVSVVYKGRLLDHVVRVVSLLGVATPAFWLALVLLIVFFLQLRWLPGGGRIGIGIEPPKTITGLYLFDSLVTGNWEAFRSSFLHLILPAFTIAFGGIGRISRIARAAMLSVAGKDYVAVGRAKGLRERTVLLKYILRNSLIPVLATVGVVFGYLMGGSILTETIFSWPGMGRYIVHSAIALDYKAVTGAALVTTFIYALANLIVDVSYAYVNPQITYD